MHPQLDMIDQIVRIFGWPTLLCTLVWLIRTWDKGQRQVAEIDANTKTTIAAVSVVKDAVDKMTNNHLAHLQAGIEQVAKSNDEAVEILHKINTGISVLTDRFPRA